MRCACLLVCLTAVCFAQPRPPSPLKPPRSLAYVLQAERLAGAGSDERTARAKVVAALAACDRQLLILDAGYTPDSPWTAPELKAIRAGFAGRRLLCYLSIGEAEDYRAYWKRSWDANKDGKPDAGAPGFLCPVNPDWAGNYKVRYWREAWQALILARVDAIAAQGFDGLYLDIVDAFEHFERDGERWIDDRRNPETRRSYRDDMQRWVTGLGARAVAKGMAHVVPQNGEALLPRPAFRRVISGVGIEDLLSDGREPTAARARTARLAPLRLLAAEGKAVLLVDYAEAASLRKRVQAEAKALRWPLLITRRSLAELGVSSAPSR